MAIFLITPLAHNGAQIGGVVQAKFKPEDFYELQSNAGYLVKFQGTSVELSHSLGITSASPDAKPTITSAMITTVGSYYGRGPTTMWEWLKTRIESQA